MSRYIDADKLVEYEEHAWDWDTVNGIETAIALRQVISDIRHEPTADVVEVKHGEWIPHPLEKGEMSIDRDVCSICGVQFADAWMFDYCPICGSYMRGDTDDKG